MIRFATIGTNKIVDIFLESAKSIKDFEYVCVYSRNEDTAKDFATKHNAKRYTTNLLDIAIAIDIDAVYIASPNSLHCEHSILMLKNKKHVLCEKAISSNEKEVKEMLKVAEDNGVILLEAMRSVFDTGFKAIENNLHKLGKIRRATFQYCQYSSRYDNFKNGIIENAFNPSFSNGALMDIGVYCIYPMVHLFGKPDNIASNGVILENGIDGAGTIIFSYDNDENNMQGELMYSKISNSYMPSQIQGENASMIIEEIPDTREITIIYNNGSKENITIDKPTSNMVYEIQAFINFIKNNEKPLKYNQSSIMEMEVVDVVKNQLGIVFPADKEERWNI